MQTIYAFVVCHVITTIASFALIGSVSAAEALPKTGVISVHSGYTAIAEQFTLAEKPQKHVQGHGTDRGVTFNDKGSGPLHLGPTGCVYTYYAIGDSSKNQGYCGFGDPDGDRIFTTFTGKGTPEGDFGGMHDIQGGTGKYAGITGTVAWKCRFAGANGEFQCTQRFDYKLP